MQRGWDSHKTGPCSDLTILELRGLFTNTWSDNISEFLPTDLDHSKIMWDLTSHDTWHQEFLLFSDVVAQSEKSMMSMVTPGKLLTIFSRAPAHIYYRWTEECYWLSRLLIICTFVFLALKNRWTSRVSIILEGLTCRKQYWILIPFVMKMYK